MLFPSSDGWPSIWGGGPRGEGSCRLRHLAKLFISLESCFLSGMYVVKLELREICLQPAPFLPQKGTRAFALFVLGGSVARGEKHLTFELGLGLAQWVT